MEDRSGRWVDVMAAANAGPRLALLGGRIAPKDALALAARAFGVFSVRGIASAPQMLQAGSVVGELGLELGDRVVGGRRLGSTRLVAIGRWHNVKLLDTQSNVKAPDKRQRYQGTTRYSALALSRIFAKFD